MDLGQLTTLVRTQLVTLGYEQVTMDEILAAYLNDAYFRFVSLAGNIDDVIEVNVTAGEAEVDIPAWVLKVKRAELGGDELVILNRSDLSAKGLSPASECRAVVLGDSRYKAYIYGTPKVSGEMSVWVLRSVKSAMFYPGDVPVDMEPEYHTALVDFAVSSLLKTQPGDLNRVSLIRDRAAAFYDAVAQVKAVRERQRSKPLRIVRYGGI